MLRNVMCAAIAMTMMAGEASVYAGHHRGRNAQCCGVNTSYQHTRNHCRTRHHHSRCQVAYQNSGWDNSCCPSYSDQNCGCDARYSTAGCNSLMWQYRNVACSQPAVDCCTTQAAPVQPVPATVADPQPQVPTPATAQSPGKTIEPVTVAEPVQPPALITETAPPAKKSK